MTTAFFKLTNAAWLETFKQLTKSELGILLHLRTLNPFGDRAIEINTAKLSQILALSRRTIQRGLKRLKDLSIIEISTAIVKCTFTQEAKTETTANTPPRQGCRTSDKNVATAPNLSSKRQECRKQTPNPAQDNQSGTSQTLQTWKDFLISLSEVEREKFFNFVKEKTKDFERPIVSITDYLRSQSRYLEFYQQFRGVVSAEEISFNIEEWKNQPEWPGIKASIAQAGPAFVGIGGIDRAYEYIPHKVRRQILDYVKASQA